MIKLTFSEIESEYHNRGFRKSNKFYKVEDVDKAVANLKSLIREKINYYNEKFEQNRDNEMYFNKMISYKVALSKIEEELEEIK